MADDPDETDGRKLYRDQAEARRKPRLKPAPENDDPGRPVPPHGSGP